MIKDLRFNLFKEHMSKTTDKLLKEYDSFKGQNAVTLKIYSDIVFHLAVVDIDKDPYERSKKSSMDYYNFAYKTIEKLYLNYLEILLDFKKIKYKSY